MLTFDVPLRKWSGVCKMPEFETFAGWVKYHREKERYSMRALAQAIHRSHTYIQKLEEDERGPEHISRPPLDIVDSLAQVLDTDQDVARYLAGYPQTEPSAVKSPIPTSVIEFYEGDVTPEERAFVEQTIAMIGNARMRLHTRLGQ